MNIKELRVHLKTATEAAHSAGQLMRQNLHKPKRINSSSQRDIKLELDVRCQKRIEKILGSLDSEHSISIVGEEGIVGNPEAEYRWVVDPIDGTVNFTYGIPHACVSIALQKRNPTKKSDPYETILGLVYEPFNDEIWTRIGTENSRLNGKKIQASERKKLSESIVSFGFPKEASKLNRMLPTVTELFQRVRKVRMMGAAALAICYVASGRMDGFLEYGLRLWDIAAAGFILEGAGGKFWTSPLAGEYTYHVRATNRHLHNKLNASL